MAEVGLIFAVIGGMTLLAVAFLIGMTYESLRIKEKLKKETEPSEDKEYRTLDGKFYTNRYIEPEKD